MIHIGRYIPSLSQGCCSNKVYALLFNNSNEAMKKITTSPLLLSMAAYTTAEHASFCMVLGEHPHRTKYYYYDFQSSEFDLAETPDGEEYWLEIWQRTASNTSYSRSQDTLHECYGVQWDGTRLIGTKLSQSQLDKIANWEVHCAASYEPKLQEIRIIAWLERNKQIHQGSQSVRVEVYNRSGSKIVDDTITTQRVPGFFAWDSPGVSLLPDDAYIVTATIKNSEGNDYLSGESIVTWN